MTVRLKKKSRRQLTCTEAHPTMASCQLPALHTGLGGQRCHLGLASPAAQRHNCWLTWRLLSSQLAQYCCRRHLLCVLLVRFCPSACCLRHYCCSLHLLNPAAAAAAAGALWRNRVTPELVKQTGADQASAAKAVAPGAQHQAPPSPPAPAVTPHAVKQSRLSGMVLVCPLHLARRCHRCNAVPASSNQASQTVDAMAYHEACKADTCTSENSACSVTAPTHA